MEAATGLTLESSAFQDKARIPDRYTCMGDDISPPLAWTGAPSGTRSFALLCDDPDAPAGTWHHWAAFDIPVDRDGLPEAFPKQAQSGGIRQAINDFRRSGYGGPCPPPGHGVHRYRFRLLALGVETLELGSYAKCEDVARAAEQHILEETVLVGTYSR